MSNYALAITDGRKMVTLGLYARLDNAVCAAAALMTAAEELNSMRVRDCDSYFFDMGEVGGIVYRYRELYELDFGRYKYKLIIQSLSGTCGYDF